MGDPLAQVADDLARLEKDVRARLETDLESAGRPMLALFGSGGKRLRPALVLLAGRLGGAGYERCGPAAAAFELVHASTLVHDDVIDHSPTRRGSATVAAEHGEGRAIVVGDFYFARAYREAARCGDPAVVALLAEAVMSVCEGELHQQAERFRYRPGMYRYFRRIRLKTASLLEAACRAGALLGGLDAALQDSLGRYGLFLGLAFQIADDLLDYTGEEEEVGKPVGHDLLEGSATLPLMLALADPAVSTELDGLLPDRTPLTGDQVARVVELVRGSNAPRLAVERAERLAARAREALDPLPAGAPREALQALASYVAERRV